MSSWIENNLCRFDHKLFFKGSLQFRYFQINSKKMMQKDLLGGILNNIVLEKVVRDKIVMQQKEQREQQAAERRRQAQEDQLDEFDDEETKAIMRKMKEERLRMDIEVPRSQKEETRTVGEYREITQDDFLSYVTRLKFTVVHFFHKDFQRCKVMDHHLKILCQQFPQTQFLSINAEKCPFFIQKLSIRMLPTLCYFVNGVLKGKQLGFQGLSGDEFVTYQLAVRLAQAGIVTDPKEKIKDKTIIKGGRNLGEDSQEDEN